MIPECQERDGYVRLLLGCAYRLRISRAILIHRTTKVLEMIAVILLVQVIHVEAHGRVRTHIEGTRVTQMGKHLVDLDLP